MRTVLLFVFFVYQTMTCLCKHKIHRHHHVSTMICLGINKIVIVKNKTISLTKICKTATFNLKKVNLKSHHDIKEICGGI